MPAVKKAATKKAATPKKTATKKAATTSNVEKKETAPRKKPIKNVAAGDQVTVVKNAKEYPARVLAVHQGHRLDVHISETRESIGTVSHESFSNDKKIYWR